MIRGMRISLIISLLIPSLAMSQEHEQEMLSVTVSLGTGIANMPDGSSILGYEQDVEEGGFALSPLHLYFESHLKLDDLLQVGLFYRLQTDQVNHLVGAQLKAKLISGPLHKLEGIVGVGYGYINHIVPVFPSVSVDDPFNNNDNSLETVYGFTQSGALSVKFGFTYSYVLVESWSFITSINAYHFTEAMQCQECTSLLQLDLNLGISKSF